MGRLRTTPAGVLRRRAAKVRLRIYKGTRLRKKLTAGTRTTGSTQSYKWTCKLPKGKYTWKVYATDRNGRAAVTVGSKKLTVR